MDYTKNKEVMDTLTELSKEIEGYNYSVNSGYSGYSEVILQRRKQINEKVAELKRLLTQ